MEKKMNKVEEIEINEEVKAEELTEETLDEVDGGFDPVTIGLTALFVAEVARVGRKILCK